MEFKEACEKAKQCLIKSGYLGGFIEIVDIGDSWLFRSIMSLDSEVEIGNNPVSIDKNSGDLIPFMLGITEDRRRYYDGKEVDIPEEYRLIEKMTLAEYLGKNVIITDNDGKKYSGHVSDYIEAEDNESGKESIIIDTEAGKCVEFEAHEIVNAMII